MRVTRREITGARRERPSFLNPWALIRLQVLGTLRVEGTDPGVADELLGQPKALALLLYLALARPAGLQQRDRLVGLFWPELDQDRARTALRGSLHRLRQLLGDDTIENRGSESIALAPERVTCDALAFLDAVANDRLRAAVNLYQGELLPSFFLPGSDEFERWLEMERAYYAERFVHCAWQLVEQYEQDSEATNATHLARVVARIASTDERMLRRVITKLYELHDRAGAIEVYSRFAARLRKDYDIEPSAETARLVERIKSGDPL
jgi:serine/threonine-protein kinase